MICKSAVSADTIIFASRLAPNRLFVEESTTDDNSVACLSAAKMEELGLFRGDTSESNLPQRQTSTALMY